MAAWCCSVCLCQLRSGAPAGAAAALVELLLRNGEFLCVGGGRGRLLGLGFGFSYFLFFFLPLQSAFSLFNTRWFGTSPVLAKCSREAALVSAHSGIKAACEFWCLCAAVTLWLPKSGNKMGALLALFLGSQVKLEHELILTNLRRQNPKKPTPAGRQWV